MRQVGVKNKMRGHGHGHGHRVESICRPGILPFPRLLRVLVLVIGTDSKKDWYLLGHRTGRAHRR
jgi:hypothetical protein